MPTKAQQLQATRDFRFVMDAPQNIVAQKLTALRESNAALVAVLSDARDRMLGNSPAMNALCKRADAAIFVAMTLGA